MNHTLLRCCALLLLLALGVFGSRPAEAARIRCHSPSMTTMSFGPVDPQSTQTDSIATFSMLCENDGIALERAATVCLSVGQPREMTNGPGTLDFELYTDPSHTTVWGSQFTGSEPPLKFNIRVPPEGADTPSSVTMYGRVKQGQTTALPGVYTKSYSANNDARVTVNAPATGNTAPGSCNTNPTGSLYFPFTVSATVVKKCTVTASPLNFGASPGLLTAAVDASTTLDVQCSRTTPYNVGLGAGQNSSSNFNARKMALGQSRVDYQLYRDPARTLVWGDAVATDRVDGTGTGSIQSLTVYGTVPAQVTPPAGTYQDTVVVTVTY